MVSRSALVSRRLDHAFEELQRPYLSSPGVLVSGFKGRAASLNAL